MWVRLRVRSAAGWPRVPPAGSRNWIGETRRLKARGLAHCPGWVAGGRLGSVRNERAQVNGLGWWAGAPELAVEWTDPDGSLRAGSDEWAQQGWVVEGAGGMGRPLLVRAAVRREFESRMGRAERPGALALGARLGPSGGLECPGYWAEWGAVQ